MSISAGIVTDEEKDAPAVKRMAEKRFGRKG